jgi:hypothetical protein
MYNIEFKPGTPFSVMYKVLLQVNGDLKGFSLEDLQRFILTQDWVQYVFNPNEIAKAILRGDKIRTLDLPQEPTTAS